MVLDPDDLFVDHSVITEVDGVYYMDIIAGSDDVNLPVTIKANLTTTYSGFAPTVYDTIWTVTSDQFDQITDDVRLNTDGTDYFIENDGIVYKNNNKEANSATIAVRTTDNEFVDSIAISSMGIKFKNNVPVSYINNEYVYTDLLSANDSVNIKNLFDFVPSEDYVSIESMQVTSDLADMVDYTLEHNVFTITHVKSYDYDDSKPIGINVIASSYAVPNPPINIFIRIKLVAMNYMVEFGYNNNLYSEEMYNANYDPDETNEYYSNNIKLTMRGKDAYAIPDDYRIDDVVFGSSDNSITSYYSYDPTAISHKDYDITYKLNKPGTTIINAKTNDNLNSTTASISIYGVSFTQKNLDVYTETTRSISNLVVSNSLPSYGILVYDIDATLSDPDVLTLDHYTGEIVVGENTGKVYIKAYYENYPRLYDYIIIEASVAPTEQCVDIEIISSDPTEINNIIIRDDTDLRDITFKQVNSNSQYIKPDVQLYSVDITGTNSAINYTNHPGSRPSTYQYINIATETPLLHTGQGTLTAVSWDQNVTKTLPVKFGNRIISANFPASYNDFKININDQPAVKIIKLMITSEYPGYKPSSTCSWSSSNPSILDVDPNGYIQKDTTDSNNYNFFTTYTVNDQSLIGNVTITATTTYGSYSFNIIVYDSVAPVEKNMLNIHEINMVYTNDPLEYQLSIVDGTTGTVSWTSDKPSIAIVSDNGHVTITDVPAENEFTYYTQGGEPLEEVTLDFYIHVSVQTGMINYVDKCKVHIVGESKGVPTAKLVYTNNINVEPGSDNSVQFVATPYYLKNNDDNNTITFTSLNDPNVPDPFTVNSFNYPANFDINGEINATFKVGNSTYINNIISEELEFEELPNEYLNGDYDFDEANPDFDYDLTELTEDSHIPFPDMGTTPYDEDVVNRQYTIHLNNPKNSYGIGVIDSTLNIHINQ